MPHYDLSHMSFHSTNIGNLKFLTAVPMIAGDRCFCDGAISLRLQPQNTFTAVDPIVDFFAFEVKMRHLYGDDWIDFIKDGTKESFTFPTLTLGVDVDYWGVGEQTGTMPAHGHRSVARIWNEYFRDPSDDASIISDTTALTSDAERIAGPLCARPYAPYTTGMDKDLIDADREVTVSGGVFDLADLASVEASYATEIERQWFGQRYRDILKEFGGYANVDADERPTLLNRKQTTLSGYDIDGTGAGTLGTYAGKSGGLFRFGFPTKYWAEHSIMFIAMLVRYPNIYNSERHPFWTQTNPSYGEISGDPQYARGQIPYTQNLSEWFADGSVAAGLVPWGQRFRYQGNIVGSQFQQQTTFPFLPTPTSHNAARYCQANEHQNVFQTAQNLQVTAISGFRMMCDRVTPGPISSIFAALT